MLKFIHGMDLCESFFKEAAQPILNRHFPQLEYSAGLIGYGSDVLGYDDEVSTDHMWGPRFYLFLKEEDLSLKEQIMDVFSRQLPYVFEGYSVHFSKPDPNDGGVRHPERITEGLVSPLIFIDTFSGYLNSYLGTDALEHLTWLDWVSFSEHRLLAITSGRWFVDQLGLQKHLDPIRQYPKEMRLYLIASNWSLIAEEQAYVRRCYDVGDSVGSVLVCSRIVDRLMRLAFLYCRKYAPYSKWFGRAFSELPMEDTIKQQIQKAVTATTIEKREEYLVYAQKLFADWHNSLHLSEPVEVQIQTYFNRKIQVIFADRIAAATQKCLRGTPFECCPLIGTMSQVANFTQLFDHPKYRRQIQALYQSCLEKQLPMKENT